MPCIYSNARRVTVGESGLCNCCVPWHLSAFNSNCFRILRLFVWPVVVRASIIVKTIYAF